MYLFSNLVGETLTFNQPSMMKREFELISSKEVLATMVFPKLFSNNVVIEGFDGKWEIRQPSIWRREYGIYKLGYSLPFAKYASNFWRTKGTIELPKGARLNCKAGRIKNPFEIYSSTDEPLIFYANKFSLKGRTTVTIEKKFELLESYPWVVMLGCYVILQNRRGRARAGR